MLRSFERFTLGPTPAWIIAAALLALGIAAVRSRRRRVAFGGSVVREVGIVTALYGLWMFLGAHSGTRGADRAYGRGHDILRAERATHLDMEAWLQHGILGHRWLVESANVFYATVHFPAMGALLVWAFLRHRDRYAEVRLRVVLVTLACLLIQLVAVAPPRLLAGSGLVDTARKYGQSVYASGFAQVSAMPSVHIAWSTLVAWEVLRIGRSRLRGLVVLLPLVTFWVVMVTGNHWFFDGLAGAAIVAVFEVLLGGVSRARSNHADDIVRPIPVAAPERVRALTR
jgi:hypothetical protein